MDADFAARIKAARTAAGLTQLDLAFATGLTLSTVRSYERQGRNPQSTHAYRELARALHVTGDYLLGITGEGADAAAIRDAAEAMIRAADAAAEAEQRTRADGAPD